jgi:hypothetical protein
VNSWRRSWPSSSRGAHSSRLGSSKGKVEDREFV